MLFCTDQTWICVPFLNFSYTGGCSKPWKILRLFGASWYSVMWQYKKARLNKFTKASFLPQHFDTQFLVNISKHKINCSSCLDPGRLRIPAGIIRDYSTFKISTPSLQQLVINLQEHCNFQQIFVSLADIFFLLVTIHVIWVYKCVI
jgi:hypothetical protein